MLLSKICTVQLKKTVIKEAKILRELQHNNIVSFIQGNLQGACGDDVRFPVLKIPAFKDFSY